MFSSISWVKEKLKQLISIGIGEEITKLNEKVEYLTRDNTALLAEIVDIKKNELALLQRLSYLEGKFAAYENMASQNRTQQTIIKEKTLDYKDVLENPSSFLDKFRE